MSALTIPISPSGPGGSVPSVEFYSGGFEHLQAWVAEATGIVVEGLQRANRGELGVGPELQAAADSADEELVGICVSDAGRIIERLRLADDPESLEGAAYRQRLIEHGLARDNAGWRFKEAVYTALRDKWRELWDRWHELTEKQRFRVLKIFRRLLSSINGILKSLLDALGAGAALVEIKDAYEALLGEVEDQISESFEEE